jgi:hypothetical protein
MLKSSVLHIIVLLHVLTLQQSPTYYRSVHSLTPGGGGGMANTQAESRMVWGGLMRLIAIRIF